MMLPWSDGEAEAVEAEAVDVEALDGMGGIVPLPP